MNKLVFALIFAFAAYASAGLLSYTAYSKKSQKDADQLALDGLAKQLRSKVESEFAVTKTEDAEGNILPFLAALCFQIAVFHFCLDRGGIIHNGHTCPCGHCTISAGNAAAGRW